MLTIDIISVGKLKQNAEDKLQKRYLERLRKAGPAQGIKTFNLTELTESKQASTSRRKTEEAKKLLSKVPGAAYLIALDENGKSFTSANFAKRLLTQKDEGTQNICFVLGGPDGHDPDLLQKAQLSLSLSPMTLPHGLARIILLEQLYRSLTIWSGHPYHRI